MSISFPPKWAKNLENFFDHPGETSMLDFTRISKDVGSVISAANKIVPSKKLDSALHGISLAVNVASLGTYAYQQYRLRKEGSRYTIRVSESDSSFSIAERWLEESMSEEQTRSSFVSTRIRSGESNIDSWEATAASVPKKVSLQLKFDGSFVQEIEIGGHKVRISTTVPDTQGAKDERSKTAGYFKDRTINFECRTIEARNAVVEALSTEAQKLAYRSPTFYHAMKWGGYRTVSDIPVRDINSVVLKEGQMERIIDFLKRFLDNEEVYTKLGVPYRTGLLLYGNPGSGKSSTATAIAYELGLNICYISLSALDDDEALGRALSDVPPRSIVVLEDVDVYRAMKSREKVDHSEDSKSGVTMSGLLNALDGFLAPHGTITVMTTNYIEDLDPAVIRPGRVDLKEEIDELDTQQLERMCKVFIGYVPDGLPSALQPHHRVTSAQVLGVIRSHIPNVENAGPDIVKFVTDKLEEFTKNSV